ncbi:hypothetical protein F4782DRAFT_541876 [Xylaria castorea]|nr:hypothetical protein F4782DRAFT_541876 [Xylaria castorea]
MGAKLIGVQRNYYRPGQYREICKKTRKVFTKRFGISRPTKCLFLAEDGSLKWVGVNAGVFPGRWSFKDISRLIFPAFPTGSWNVGQIRRLQNGEVVFTETLEMELEGIDNTFVWHPTKIEFTEFELVSQFEHTTRGRLWHAKHPRFNEEPIFVKIAPWANNWSKQAMEAETRVYQLVDGLGIAPKFLGHVTHQGAIIGFILKWVEGAKTTKKKDRSARIEVMKKLHSLGITHGSAHHENFLKVGEDVLMIDFEEARFGHRATDQRKNEDIRRIYDFWGDMCEEPIDGEEDDFIPEVSKFFDPLIDNEVHWTSDSEAGKSDPKDD